MKTISLKLPEALERRLTTAVARRGVKKSDFVRQAIEAHVTKGEAREPGSILDLAGDLIGCVKGPRDLASNPRYLDDLGR